MQTSFFSKLTKRLHACLSRFLLVIAGLFFYSAFCMAQCDTDAFLDKCAQNLGSYNYIKSFVATSGSRRKDAPEYRYVFSKGSKYIMIACPENENESRMVISLYDRDHNLLACNYDENSDKYYTELQYPCSATGVYYVKAKMEGSKKACGLCILGFTKD
jgi:hypothetical protein